MKPIVVKQEAIIPTGAHLGIIVGVDDEPVTFNPSKGPEDNLDVTIQPSWRRDEATATLPVSVSFKPTLNSLSALSKLLERLKIPVKPGDSFDPGRMTGTSVYFTAKKDDKTGFIKVDKDSIRASEPGDKERVIKNLTN